MLAYVALYTFSITVFGTLQLCDEFQHKTVCFHFITRLRETKETNLQLVYANVALLLSKSAVPATLASGLRMSTLPTEINGIAYQNCTHSCQSQYQQSFNENTVQRKIMF